MVILVTFLDGSILLAGPGDALDEGDEMVVFSAASDVEWKPANATVERVSWGVVVAYGVPPSVHVRGFAAEKAMGPVPSTLQVEDAVQGLEAAKLRS